MLRSLVVIFCCACVAVVLSEAVGVLLLWHNGMLTADHLKEVRLVFTNGLAAEQKAADEADATPLASLEEVTEARAVKILDLDKRENELTVLKTMATDKSNDLDVEQQAFLVQKKEFEEKLAQLKAAETAAATEQARGVLLAMAPKDAVAKLMQLTLEEDVVLLKGMQEKVIAKILKEFNTSMEQVDRSRKIFAAINRGEPTRPLVDETLNNIITGPNGASAGETVSDPATLSAPTSAGSAKSEGAAPRGRTN